jgi:hypothetical protein
LRWEGVKKEFKRGRREGHFLVERGGPGVWKITSSKILYPLSNGEETFSWEGESF